MKKIKFKPLVDATKKWFADNAPGLMVGSGTVILVAASGVAVYSTVKAVRAVDAKKEEKENRGEEFRPVVDTVIVAAPKYILPVGMVVAGTILNYKGFKKEAKIATTVLTAYAITSEKHEVLEEKLKEMLNKNKEEEVRTEMSQEISNRHPESTHTIIMDQDGTWFYDPVSNTDFKSTITKVEDAVNRINHAMGYGAQPYASMNEFQHLLGIPMTENVDNLGWSSETMLELRWHTIERNGHPAFCLDYNVKPYLDYDVSPDRRHHLRDLM